MTIRLHDTLTGEDRMLEPLEAGHVRIYSCGPTVYGPTHIGNFRSFLFADLLVRHLRRSGLRVTWVMNITDIDDKIIKGAARDGVSIQELTDRWLAVFRGDADRLAMTTPDVLPRATEHVPEIVALIATLLERGHAYRTDDGSIFFRIASWPAYGRLARLDPEQMRTGERVEADEYAKDDVRDFALWKGPKAGEPSWDTSIGPGRPGWHIECSAMSMRHLGRSFDIHTGGVDLIFPHHENEIAQAEGATKQTFSRFWVHVEHLFVENEKMSKSLGNVYTIPQVVERGHRASSLRYLLLSSHYRKQLNFTWAGMEQAEESLRRMVDFLGRLDDLTGDGRPDIHDHHRPYWRFQWDAQLGLQQYRACLARHRQQRQFQRHGRCQWLHVDKHGFLGRRLWCA